MAGKPDREDKLHTRHVVARAFVTGQLGYLDEHQACESLGISAKTLRRDIARYKISPEFDDWRPKKTGPPQGQRQTKSDVRAEIESLVYAAADQKRNLRKLGRDLELLLPGMGFSALDVPSPSTLERIVRDIEDADPAYFAERRHGRAGRADYSLQLGSLETDRPLQIVCIDHTVLNARSFLIEGQSVVVRPTFTAAIDLYTSCCLAAFISAFPPCAITVSLAMALMAVPKTGLLKRYGVPGEWEAGGLGEILYVDGAGDLTGKHVQRGCRLNGIQLRIGWPGRPERRGRMERFWKTTESEIHSWPGTTLGNPQELEAHGGQKPPAWSFDVTQRQVLAMVMTHINETYEGDEIPPIMRWREAAGTVRMARMIPHDPWKTFLDFLPTKERCKVNFQGIKLFNCHYRSGDLAKLRYEGVKRVEVVYDPRDVSRIWVVHDKRYIEIPRVHPRSAPKELRALKAWQAGRRAVAREKRDTALLQRLASIRRNPFAGLFDEVELPEPTPEEVRAARARYRISDLPTAQPESETSLQGPGPAEPTSNPEAGLPPNFNIPTFHPRVR